MGSTASRATSYISRVSLTGQGGGAVKALGGFRKQHHTVPDAVNAATTAFLAKLCTEELAEEAEGYFQRSRTAMGYKRADLSLDVTPPTAVLTAKDFTFEMEYALEPDDPASYRVTRTLYSLGNAALVEVPEFDALFAGTFSTIVFGLAKGVKVEAVIDAVEARPAGDPLTVTYPSDCRHCVLAVAGVDATVVCDGAVLELRFMRSGSPRELMEAFARVREAFRLAKAAALAGLL